MTRAAHDGVEQPFAAEQHVFRALDALQFHRAGGVHRGKIAGVEDLAIAGGNVIFDRAAVDFQKDDAAAGELLHQKAFAAKQSAADALLEKHGHIHVAARREKRALLGDDGTVGCDLDRFDGAGERGRKRDLAGLFCHIAVFKHLFAGNHAAEHLAEAATFGFHFDFIVHPGHGSAFAHHLFAGFKLAQHDRQIAAFDLITHSKNSFEMLLKGHAFTFLF